MRRRVIATPRSAWIDPAIAFDRLCRGDQPAFWLDSGVNATTGWSYLGVASRTVTASVADHDLLHEPSGRREAGTILDFLRGEQASSAAVVRDAAGVGEVGPFRLGWVGWLGYELHAQTVGTASSVASRHPDAALLFADRALVFDHAARTVVELSLTPVGSMAAERGPEQSAEQGAGVSAEATPTLLDRLGDVPENQALPGFPALDAAPPTVTWSCSDEEYLERIASCQRSIAAGEAYQLCLTTEARVNVRPDPVDTYLALRRRSPSHHGGFVRIGGVSLLSSSPEQFLVVSGGEKPRHVETKPIKGTRPRGATPLADDALRSDLLDSEKERAENLMIVDLMRNDLGRVCEVGTVRVPHLLTVESYAQVHQLVSTVSGTLAGHLDPVDAVAACFPAGSMTGAPKRRAIEILDVLEKRARGIYSGAFGYFALDGRVDLAMVIRSIVLDADGATIGAGGGITTLSVPREELDEVAVKAAALLAVLGVEPATGARRL